MCEVCPVLCCVCDGGGKEVWWRWKEGVGKRLLEVRSCSCVDIRDSSTLTSCCFMASFLHTSTQPQLVVWSFHFCVPVPEVVGRSSLPQTEGGGSGVESV